MLPFLFLDATRTVMREGRGGQLEDCVKLPCTEEPDQYVQASRADRPMGS